MRADAGIDPEPDVVSLHEYASRGHRDQSISLEQVYDEVQRLEIRLRNGTTEFDEIATWISLWMLILNTSRYRWAGWAAPGEVFTDGNHAISPVLTTYEVIFQLLREEGIYLPADLARMLHRRRAALRSAWARVLPRRVVSWAEAGWYDGDASAPEANAVRASA